MFDSLGERQFKNISESIPVYRLRGEQERWVFQTAPTETAPRREKRPYSIAVVPLTAQDEDVRFLADGVTEDLILELGRFRKLFVSSRTASAVLQNENRDPVAIGDALGVRYVLSGNLRRRGEKVRINLSLTETGEGRSSGTIASSVRSKPCSTRSTKSSRRSRPPLSVDWKKLTLPPRAGNGPNQCQPTISFAWPRIPPSAA